MLLKVAMNALIISAVLLTTIVDVDATSSCLDAPRALVKPFIVSVSVDFNQRYEKSYGLRVLKSNHDQQIVYRSERPIVQTLLLPDENILIAKDNAQVILLDSDGNELERDDAFSDPTFLVLTEATTGVKELVQLSGGLVMVVFQTESISKGDFQAVTFKVYDLKNKNMNVLGGAFSPDAIFPLELRSLRPILRISNDIVLVVTSSQLLLFDLLKREKAEFSFEGVRDLIGAEFMSEGDQILVQGWNLDHTRHSSQTISVLRNSRGLSVFKNGFPFKVVFGALK